MAKVFKNWSETAELVFFGVIALLALAGIIRFVVMAGIF
jgi:hypothetical protein